MAKDVTAAMELKTQYPDDVKILHYEDMAAGNFDEAVTQLYRYATLTCQFSCISRCDATALCIPTCSHLSCLPYFLALQHCRS